MDVTVTAAVIVKDEERCIKACIDSLIGIFNEIVIVDTGSTDLTVDILNSYQNPAIKLILSTWDDDFSQPRNLAIQHATSQYIFFIDADETLVTPANEVHDIFDKINKMDIDGNIILSPVIKDHNNNQSKSVKRGFKNDKGYYYFGFVHEEIRHRSIESFHHIELDIVLEHDGYKSEVLTNKKKLTRNEKLNLKNISREPDELRWSYFYYRDSFEQLDPREVYVVLLNKIKTNMQQPLSMDNLNWDRYTFSALDLMARAKLKTLDSVTEFNELIAMMNYIIPNNSNGIYYSAVYELLEWKKAVRDKISLLLSLKKNNTLYHEEMLHSEGLHIDSVLSLYMHEIGLVGQARKLMLSVRDSGFNTALMNNYINTTS